MSTTTIAPRSITIGNVTRIETMISSIGHPVKNPGRLGTSPFIGPKWMPLLSSIFLGDRSSTDPMIVIESSSTNEQTLKYLTDYKNHLNNQAKDGVAKKIKVEDREITAENLETLIANTDMFDTKFIALEGNRRLLAMYLNWLYTGEDRVITVNLYAEESHAMADAEKANGRHDTGQSTNAMDDYLKALELLKAFEIGTEADLRRAIGLSKTAAQKVFGIAQWVFKHDKKSLGQKLHEQIVTDSINCPSGVTTINALKSTAGQKVRKLDGAAEKDINCVLEAMCPGAKSNNRSKALSKDKLVEVAGLNGNAEVKALVTAIIEGDEVAARRLSVNTFNQGLPDSMHDMSNQALADWHLAKSLEFQGLADAEGSTED